MFYFFIAIITNYSPMKLSAAVSTYETHDCLLGIGKTHNSCYGLINKTYASKEESYTDFQKIWAEKYGNAFPDIIAASAWVCGPKNPVGEDCPGGSPKHWLESIKNIYDNGWQ